MKRVRYLLGLSSPAERERIELEYFEDDDAFQKMLTAEDDLIDAYARGELADEEHRRFEKSFASSFRVRDRVQFARAFAGAGSATQPVETNFFKTFRSPGLFRTATIATVIVLVAVFAWLVIDRRRMTNELRELRAQSTELSKRTEALQQTTDTEQKHAAGLAAQLADLRTQLDKPRQVEKRIDIQDALPSNAVKTKITELPIQGRKFADLLTLQPTTSLTVRGTVEDPNGKVVSGATVTLSDSAKNFTRTQSTSEDGAYVFNAIPPGTYSMEVKAPGFKSVLVSGVATRVDTPTVVDIHLELGAVSETVSVAAAAEAALNTTDASIGNSFEPLRITQLPLNANNVANLLSLQPGVTPAGVINGGRADQSNITLDGVDVNEGIDATIRIPSFDATIRLPSFLSWIRFQIALATAAIHDDYRVIIKTADGRPVMSDNWIEPLTPNQTIIDTPAISTSELPSGDYVLLLTGKEPDGSFVKVAEYFFKVIKY